MISTREKPIDKKVRSVLFRDLFAAALFVSIFIWSCSEYVVPIFGYYGYTYRQYDDAELLLAIAATAVLTVLAIIRVPEFGSHILKLLNCLVAFPIIWIATLFSSLTSEHLLELTLLVVAGFSLTRLMIGFREVSPIRVTSLSPKFYISVISVTVLTSLAALIFIYGLSPRLVSFSDAYDVRDEYNAQIHVTGRYLLGWLVNAFMALMLAFGISRDRWALASTAVGCYVLAYAMTGFKTYIIGMLLTLVAVLAVKYRRRFYSSWYMILSALLGASVLIDRVHPGLDLVSLIVRRALATTGINTTFYFEHFSKFETYKLRHSVLAPFGEPPSSLSPPRAIGEAYYGTSELAANANYLADGYANFGVFGVLLMSLLLGAYLRVVAGVSQHSDLAMKVGATTFVALALANSALLTTLMNHGGLILLLLLAVAPRDKGLDPGVSNNAVRIPPYADRTER